MLVDGRPALSCLHKPGLVEGHEVTTLEGLPEEMRQVLGEAFVLEGGVQCGFCTPGIVVRASSLLKNGQASSRESIQKALDGHLCRCTGYSRIIDAIQTAGEAWNDHHEMPRSEPRHHFYFGEQYGLKRNPEMMPKGDGSGIGASLSRLGGMKQVMGNKPFVDDMRAPEMRCYTRGYGADAVSASEGAGDRFFGSAGDAWGGESFHGGRRSRAARDGGHGLSPICRFSSRWARQPAAWGDFAWPWSPWQRTRSSMRARRRIR